MILVGGSGSLPNWKMEKYSAAMYFSSSHTGVKFHGDVDPLIQQVVCKGSNVAMTHEELEELPGNLEKWRIKTAISLMRLSSGFIEIGVTFI